jgi:hypothetical protein
LLEAGGEVVGLFCFTLELGFLFGFGTLCLRVVLGFDDDGGDGERGEKGKGVSCEWTRSCLERCLVLVRDGQGILSVDTAVF